MRYNPNRVALWNDDFFDSFFARQTSQVMACDIKETADGYELDVNLPGIEKDKLRMSLEDGYLTIEARTDTLKEEKDEGGHYLRQERYSGSYQRSFYVGEDVKETDIHAAYKDGVLKITLPKAEKQETETRKMIEISEA